MASRASLIQSRSIYVGTANNVAPSDGNLIVTGNVGIGTTAPTRKLQITDGEVYVRFNPTAVAGTYILGAADGKFYVIPESTFVPTMTFSSGNVGIGISSPSYRLDVAGGDVRFVAAASTDALVRIIAANYATEYDARLFLGENDTNGMTIEYDGSNNVGFIGMNSSTDPTGAYSKRIRMSRDGSEVSFPVGDVGIGSTAPAAKLNVASTGANAYSGTITKGTNMKGIINALSNNADDMVGIYFGTGTTSEGTHWSGITGSRSNSAVDWSTQLNFYTHDENVSNITDATQKMVIKGSGNVGIGTTAPTNKLTVYQGGGVRVTGITSGDWIEMSGDLPGYSANQYPVIKSNGTIHFANNNKYSAYLEGANTYFGILDNTTTTRVFLATSGNTYFTGGNVGIGTTAPAEKLVVSDGGAAGFEWIPSSGRWYRYNRSTSAYGGIYSEASEFTWSPYGSEAMRINGSGNVGIGTTAPAQKVQIGDGTATGSQYFRIFNSASDIYVGQSGGTIFGFSANSAGFVLSDNTSFPFGVGTTNAQPFVIGTTNAERMRITSAGNVGIGTTAPTWKLQTESSSSTVAMFRSSDSNTIVGIDNSAVDGDPQLKFYINDIGTFTLGVDDSDSDKFKIGTSDLTTNTRLTIDGSGNVGIGTTAPAYKLDVNGNARAGGMTLNAFASGTSGGNLELGFDGTQGVVQAYNRTTPDFIPLYLSGSDFRFNPNGTERMRITSAGNVGIGTTNPSVGKLEVYSTGDAPYILMNTTATANKRVRLQFTQGGNSGMEIGTDYSVNNENNFYFYDRVNAATLGFISANTTWFNGNVGIGTTAPGAKLEVNGNIKLSSTAGATATPSFIWLGNDYSNGTTRDKLKIYLYNSGPEQYGFSVGSIGDVQYHSNAIHDFYIANGNALRINSSGLVGIGTTSPTEKLHVDGNAVLTYNNSYQGINSVGNKAILARVSPTSGIINYAEYATAANLNGFVMGSDDARVKGNIATDSLEFITNGSTQVTVLSNGNVGIANTNPSEKLSVTGNIRMDNGAADGPQLVLGSSGFSDWNIDNFSGSLRAYYGSTEYTRLTSSGNFGIGVSPSYKLDVAGDTRITSGSLGVGVVPNATDGRIDASNDIVAYSSSDRRLKENITPIANALDKVKSLTGVEFDWKPEHKKAHGYEGHDTGVIAQEVQEVMPTAVRTNDTGYLAVRYEKMIGLLIEAMKEQQTQIDELKAKLDGLTK